MAPRARRIAALVLAGLVLALGACSDDGGDEAGDTSSTGTRGTAGDEELAEFCGLAGELVHGEPTAAELAELRDAAPDELEEDLELLVELREAEEAGEDLSGFDDDEIEAATLRVYDVATERCGLDDPDEEELGDPAPAPQLTDENEATYAGDCEAGNLQACDQLYFVSSPGTPGEEYGATCGGRTEQRMDGTCATVFGSGGGEAGGGQGGGGAGLPSLGAPTTPPDQLTPEQAELARSCYGGDLAACDDLFARTEPDTVGESYGATCGGRLAMAEARPGQCAALFGPEP